MKNSRIVVLCLSLGIALTGLVVVLTASSQDAGPFLPGVTVTDEHPNGCVDCHLNAGEDRDYRLNVSLKEIEGHPDITHIVKNLPADCGMCHRDGTDAGSISLITHKDHYKNPEENHFVSGYQGACLNCHTLDTATGEMGIKSAAKNW